MGWFKKDNIMTEPEFQFGDKVWINTFIKAYAGEIVGEATPDIGSKSPRVIVRVGNENLVVSRSLLSPAQERKL